MACGCGPGWARSLWSDYRILIRLTFWQFEPYQGIRSAFVLSTAPVLARHGWRTHTRNEEVSRRTGPVRRDRHRRRSRRTQLTQVLARNRRVYGPRLFRRL